MRDFLVADDTSVVVISAPNVKDALDLVAEQRKLSQYDNLVACEMPNTLAEWREQSRKLIVANGDYFEYYGRPDWWSEILLAYCEAQVSALEAQNGTGT